jgi:hypothetical protein
MLSFEVWRLMVVALFLALLIGVGIAGAEYTHLTRG